MREVGWIGSTRTCLLRNSLITYEKLIMKVKFQPTLSGERALQNLAKMIEKSQIWGVEGGAVRRQPVSQHITCTHILQKLGVAYLNSSVRRENTRILVSYLAWFSGAHFLLLGNC